MGIAAKLDDYGRWAWIALVVLAFFLWWPLGLAALAYVIGSGRMAWCGKSARFGRWSNVEERVSKHRWFDKGVPSSGNRAFDEYREETLRRLEEEQREFKSFLDRLRMARDKSEFDQFMAERRRSDNGAPSVDLGRA
jgi:hypothetical protein